MQMKWIGRYAINWDRVSWVEEDEPIRAKRTGNLVIVFDKGQTIVLEGEDARVLRSYLAHFPKISVSAEEPETHAD